MSPEQIAGKKVDGRSDLYSLGVMLFQMLTGVLPFRGDSMAELMYKIANEEAPDIRIVRKDISPKLADIVALALSKRSETRYQDGDQFAADLRAALDPGAAASASASSVNTAATMGSAAVASADIGSEKTAVFAATQTFTATQKVSPIDANAFDKTIVAKQDTVTPSTSSESPKD
jgi:serine/threonine-protein kinase